MSEAIAEEQRTLNDILHTCMQLWKWNVIQIVPIRRGWLNLKWKVVTNQGTFLIKQYNQQRFSSYEPTVLDHAFSQQDRLRQYDLPIPRIDYLFTLI